MKTTTRMMVAWKSVRSRPRLVRKTEPPDAAGAAPKPTFHLQEDDQIVEMTIWRKFIRARGRDSSGAWGAANGAGVPAIA
jgi:hypothetical protein